MDQGPLVSERIDAGARFLAEFQKHYPVQAALWVKDGDDGWWYLYVASEQITDDNFDTAYGEVGTIWRALKDPWFDPFLVKVIGADHPLAKAAVEAQRQYPSRSPVRLNGDSFGRLGIDEACVYPFPAPAPTR